MPHRQNLLQKLRNYSPKNDWEVDCYKSIIHFIEKHPTCFNRSHEAGHITGSAWVINKEHDKVALIYHPKLNMWIQPGGHSDGNPKTLDIALMEAHEELGVPLHALTPVTEDIFDVDCHLYPAREKNGKMEEMHIHYDIRFLIELDENIPFSQQEGEVVTEKRWIPLEKILHSTSNETTSLRQMASKTLEFFKETARISPKFKTS